MLKLTQSAICLLTGWGVTLAAFAERSLQDEINNLIVRQAQQNAVIVHGDIDKARDHFLEKYLDTLPREFDERAQEIFYYVEGDIRVSKEGVVRYLEDLAGGGQGVVESGELLVNLHNGALDLWTPEERRLSYAVDLESFRTQEEAEQAADELQQAASVWMEACAECGVEYVRLAPEEAGDDFENAVFVLRFSNNPFGPIARAFFPHQADRDVVVFPAYFSSELEFDRVGVMRHELGHTLGYRHEHIQSIPGCRLEDFQWVNVTPYDPNSVMHYFCGGGGGFELALSDEDIRGHRCLYLDGEPCPRSNP